MCRCVSLQNQCHTNPLYGIRNGQLSFSDKPEVSEQLFGAGRCPVRFVDGFNQPKGFSQSLLDLFRIVLHHIQAAALVWAAYGKRR